MKLLSFDTSSDACSVALQIDDEIIDRHVIDPRAHTRILLPMIRELTGAAGLQMTDFDAIVLGNGPGSFIGMRIGASVAQGICYGAKLKVVPVSSLAAVAAEVMQMHDAINVVVAQDARMGEVYIGRFARNKDGLPQIIGEEQIHAVGPLECIPDQAVAAGAAWHKYDDLALANKQQIGVVSDVSVPRARFLLPLGRGALDEGQAIFPEKLIPAYIRTKVAEIPDTGATVHERKSSQ